MAYDVNLTTALLWRQNNAANLQALLQAKQDWYTENVTEFINDWITDVFNLQTANDFGCYVWARILGISVQLASAANPGPQWGFNGPEYSLATSDQQPISDLSIASMTHQSWQGLIELLSTPRTNSFLYSASFTASPVTGSYWYYHDTTMTSGIADPSGGTQAIKLVTTVTTTAQTFYVQQISALDPTQPSTAYIYAKAGEIQYLNLRVYNDTDNTNYSTVTVNLADGTLTGVANFGTMSLTISTVSITGGWWKLLFTFSDTTAGTGAIIRFFMSTVFSNSGSSFIGDGASGLYLFAPQLELNSTTAGEYIPTEAAPVTQTDYTVDDTTGNLAFEATIVPSDVLTWTGSFKDNTESTVTATNTIIPIRYTRQNFNNGNFGVSNAASSLTTAQKRLILQLRYYQLISRCTIPEINERINAIMGTNGAIYVLDANDMSYITYVFKYVPDATLQYILSNYDILPRPAAVGVKVILSTTPVFGFGSYNENFNNGNFSSIQL